MKYIVLGEVDGRSELRATADELADRRSGLWPDVEAVEVQGEGEGPGCIAGDVAGCGKL